MASPDLGSHAVTARKGAHWVVLFAVVMGFAMVLSVVPAVRTAGLDNLPHRVGKARAIILMLQTAILAYRADWGRLPDTGHRERAEQDLAQLISLLSRHSQSGLVGYLEEGDATRMRRDPWGRQYHVWFDVNCRGGMLISPSHWVPGVVAIWSDGANRINEYGEGDDICSWKLPLAEEH